MANKSMKRYSTSLVIKKVQIKIKMKRYHCTVKENINKMKKQPTEWEKIFVTHISDKESISKIYKELI